MIKRLLLLTLTLACSPSAAPSVTVRDSAGVRIRTYVSAPDSLQRWIVDTTPSLTLPTYGPDSALLLPSPVGAMRTTSGDLVVADRGRSALLVFDSTGRLLRSLGRHGSGPEEFDFIADLNACGADTAYVEDIGNTRVTRVTQNGFINSLALGFSPRHLPFTFSCTRSGQLLMVDWPDLSTRLEAGPYRPMVSVAIGTTARPVTTRLGVFPGTEMVVKGRGISPRALGRWLRSAATDSVHWLSPNDGPFLRAYDLSGQLRLLTNPALSTQPISTAEWDFQRQRALDSAGSEVGRERMNQLFDASPPPEQLPWVHALLVDAAGFLWLHPFPTSADPNPAWRILANDGTWHAEVQLPASLTGIWEIGRDYVLGFREDADGALAVVLYPLRRPPYGA